jgi:MFS family permease
VVLLAAFGVTEARRSDPMVSPRFFRDGAFSAANAVVLLAGFALLGFVFFNTLYFQAVQGWSPLQAGLRSLPNTLTVVVCAPLAGRLASRYGYRVPVTAGLVAAAAALLALAGIEVGTPYSQLWWKLALLGAGLGLSISPATAAGVAAMPGTQAGVASAVIQTSRQVGGALGVAVLGAVAAAHDGGATPDADPAAFLAGVHAAYLVAAAALAAGAVASVLFLRPRRADPDAAGPPLPAEAA